MTFGVYETIITFLFGIAIGAMIAMIATWKER